MLSEERQRAILETLDRDGRVLVVDLALILSFRAQRGTCFALEPPLNAVCRRATASCIVVLPLRGSTTLEVNRHALFPFHPHGPADRVATVPRPDWSRTRRP